MSGLGLCTLLILVIERARVGHTASAVAKRPTHGRQIFLVVVRKISILKSVRAFEVLWPERSRAE
jgi:hypothetical protein